MAPFYTLMGVPQTGFDPEHTFETSWLLPPSLLAALRLVFSVYCFACTFTQWGWFGAHDSSGEIGQSFSYFTNLSYWGLSFYTLVAGAHTLSYALSGRAWLDRWPRPLQALHSLLYTTVITLPFLVTIVYWALLYSGPGFPSNFTAWSNVSRHGLNSLIALVELVLPTTLPPPWLHIPCLILLLALYLGLAYLTHATQGFYTYSFLDPATGAGHVAGYVFGIAVGFVVIFLLVWAAVWGRRKLTRGRVKRSKRDTKSLGGYGQGDVEMMTATPK